MEIIETIPNKVFIEGNEINTEHIQKCIDSFIYILNNENENPELIIEAKDEITSVDFSIFGHLMLFSSEYERKHGKELEIRLTLPKNISRTSDEDDKTDPSNKSITWKIRQHMIHAYFSMKERSVFSIVDGNGVFNNAEKKKNNWFVLSKKFLPITYLNKDNYESLFEKSLDFVILENLIGKGNEEDDLYQTIRKWLFDKVNAINYLQILSQLAFYKSLHKVKILRFYLSDRLNTNVKSKLSQVGNIKDSTEIKRYRDSIIDLFLELSKKPALFHLVFFTLISSEIVENFSGIELNKISKKVRNLWGFTEELVFGIKELAKNIIEHSTHVEGIISGFVNRNGELIIDVFDHGHESILSKFIADTNKNKNRIEKKLLEDKNVSKNIDKQLLEIYKNDLKILNSTNFDFRHFFETQSTSILFQQAKRATAHIGLLHFAKLVKKNKGQLEVVSNNFNKKVDFYPENLGNKCHITLGTIFRTILSLKKLIEFSPRISLSQPNIEKKGPIDSLNILRKFNIIGFDDPNLSKNIYKKNVICKIDFKNLSQLETVEEELIKTVLITIDRELSKRNVEDIRSKKDFVFCFNLAEIKLNGSQLLRFLGFFEILFPAKNIIIFDLTTDLFFELTQVNISLIEHIKSLPYWNKDSFLVAYSYILDNLNEGSNKNRLYFTDVLWGENSEHFKYVSRLVRRNNYNAVIYRSMQPNKEKSIANTETNDFSYLLPDNILFINKTNLLPFDLLLKNDQYDSLFESNSSFLLNKKIEDYSKANMEVFKSHSLFISRQVSELPGFKIIDSHYRLGSKIHINDFFFAKRYFQNSFFASRFAFIVTDYLLKSHDDKKIRLYDDEKLINLTLLGYGLYSELLLSLIESLLKDYYKSHDKININHNLIDDVDKMSLIKYYEDFNKNVIIIVPIASTFSTSLKIEEFIQEYVLNRNNEEIKKENEEKRIGRRYTAKNKTIEILQPHINLLVVSNGNLFDKIEPDEIEKKHGWEGFKHNERIVEVKSFFTQELRKQKYFLSLPTKWHSQNSCTNCFPNDSSCSELSIKCAYCQNIEKKEICLLSEHALHYTDKTFVTPDELFGFPEARKIINEVKFDIGDNTLKYGHTVRNNDCFQFHIFDEKFLQDNSENHPKRNKKLVSIESWLAKKVKGYIFNEDNSIIKETDNILLFAPAHFSNTVFVNKVNELVFSNTATILHYDVWNNNVSSFQTFYLELINEYKKIFFIDDTIITGGTMQKAAEFIKYSRLEIRKKFEKFNKNGHENVFMEDNFAFDGCFFLINRTTKHIDEMITGLLKNQNTNFSYANLHLPNAKAYDTKCQLCADYEKFDQLFKNSVLDKLKNHFFIRLQKLKKHSITSESYENQLKSSPDYNEKQNLIKVEITHRLFDYFKNDNNKERNIEAFNSLNFFEWQTFFLKHSNSSFSRTEVANTPDILFPLSETTCVLLKVLALHPFSLHKPIKDRVFKWTNSLLNECIEIIKNEGKISNIKQFRDIKFLIRRAGLLKSNYIISTRLLLFIAEFIPKFLILKEIKYDDLDKRIKEDLQLFHTKNGNSFTHKYQPQLDELEEEIESIRQFAIYFLAQIKELIYKNEGRSIMIEQRVAPLFDDVKYSESKQLFRMILEENGVLIHCFWEQIRKEMLEIDVSRDASNIIWFVDENKALRIVQKRQNIFDELIEFFDASQEERPLFNKSLFSFLRIKSFLSIDSDKDNHKKSNVKGWKLHEKTQGLCKSIENMFLLGTSDVKLGAFLIVKFKENDKKENDLTKYMFPAYNEGYAKEAANLCLNEQGNYIAQFIEGIPNRGHFPPTEVDNPDKITYNASIDVLSKCIQNDNISWTSDYAVPNVDSITIDFFKNETEIKHILILRFSEKTIKEEDDSLRKEPQGAIVLYSNKNIFEYQKIRYLLLLRKSICNFLSKHHKNDEFRDWFEISQNGEIVRAFTHGVDTYSRIVDNLVIKLKENDFTQVKIIETIYNLILNKQVLLRFISDYSIQKDLNKALKLNYIDPVGEPFTFSELELKITDFAEGIFSFYHPKYFSFEEYYELHFTDNTKGESLFIYEKFFNEIIFEVFYNIRKYYHYLKDDKIYTDNKMKIHFIISVGSIQIENNFATLHFIDNSKILNLNITIRDKTIKKGLNLINSISEILYKEKCILYYNNDIFKIFVPLKKQ